MVMAARFIALFIISACFLAWMPETGAQTVHDEFDALERAFRHQLRHTDADKRIETIHALKKYPVADSAKLLHGCFIDEDNRVRSAAFDVLHGMNCEQEVCDALLAEAKISLKRQKDSQLVLPALAVLMASKLPMAQSHAQRFLDDHVAKSPQGVELLIGLADELGHHGKVEDVMPLARLSNVKLFASHSGLRRAVVQALTKTPKEASIGPLIGMLDVVGGEARADAVRYLRRVTDQPFGLRADDWQRWFAARETPGSQKIITKTTAQFTVVVNKAEELDTEAAGQYYGLPLFAERLVFVLDISGSMQGGRIMAAKLELVRAIQGLPEHTQFGVVMFNGHIHRWQRALVAATAKNKESAILYVERQPADGSTASFDALDAALTYDTEAIYFLSDGAPTAGKILAPVDIIQAMIDVNRIRRISIYTIGIAPGFPGSPTDEFLRVLSEKNYGQYRRIDG